MTTPYATNPRRDRSGDARQRNLWALAVLTMLGAALCGLTFVVAAIFVPNAGDRQVTVPSTPAASPAVKRAPVAARPKPTPAPAATTYAKLTARQWLKIAKDPDAYAGRTYVVYGVVTQFDAATGRDTFRANVDGVKHELGYDYPTNAIMDNGGADLDDLVEDDQFTARVQVLGGYTYATQLGGETTAPQLTVHRLVRR